MRFRNLLPAAVLGVILVSVAAGCTAVGPTDPESTSAAAAPAATSSSTQTKAQACSVLATSMETLSTKLSSEYSSFAKNPKAAVTAIQQLATAFDANVQKVTEPGALALATKANADLTTFVADAKEAVSHPLTGIAKVQELAPTLEADFTKVSKYCG